MNSPCKANHSYFLPESDESSISAEAGLLARSPLPVFPTHRSETVTLQWYRLIELTAAGQPRAPSCTEATGFPFNPRHE